jgi:hypothetical protein
MVLNIDYLNTQQSFPFLTLKQALLITTVKNIIISDSVMFYNLFSKILPIMIRGREINFDHSLFE